MAEWKAVLSSDNAWRYDDEGRHFADALLHLRGHLHCEPVLLGAKPVGGCL
jgi:hypothetical protein